VLGEILRLQSLTLQTPLYIGESHHNGVNVALVDAPAKIMDAEMTDVAQFGHVVPHSLVECMITTPVELRYRR
jgi:hypothetical protein